GERPDLERPHQDLLHARGRGAHEAGGEPGPELVRGRVRQRAGDLRAGEQRQHASQRPVAGGLGEQLRHLGAGRLPRGL
ncbi:MAG: hypothetical protein AVDCRST_MAG68-2463, partial [uncultured Gemmatimonadetes bacterium]